MEIRPQRHIVITDPTLELAQQLRELGEETRDAELEAARASAEEQTRAVARQVSSLHESADFSMAAGLSTSVAKVVSAGVSAAAPTVDTGAESALPSAANQAAASTARDYGAAATMIDAAGSAGSAIFTRFAGAAEADSVQHRAEAERAASRTTEHMETAKDVARQQEEVLAVARATIEARRQAEQAAIRA